MKPFSKLLTTLFVAFVCTVLLLLALLPTLASSSWGKDKLLSLTNMQIPGNVSIDKLSLNWLGPQAIQGAVLKDPQGLPVISLQKAATQSSLFRLFWNKIATGSFEIESLSGTLSTDASGNTNLDKALNKNCCALKTSEGNKPLLVNFKNVNAVVNFDAHNNQPATLHIAGETLQDNLSGKFVIDAELKGVDIERLRKLDQGAIENLRTSSQAELKVNADIFNLPVSLLDQIAALSRPDLAGMLTELIGPQLDLTLRQTANPHGMNFALNAKSQLLSAAIDAVVAADISLVKPATVSLKLTPALIDKLAAVAETEFPWSLQNPTAAQLVIDRFNYPLNLIKGKSLSEFDLTQLALQAKLTLQQATLQGGSALGNIDVQQLIGSLVTETGSKKVVATLNGEAKQNAQPFKINMTATLTKPAKLSDFLNDLHRQISLDGEIRGFPISALDAHLGQNGRLQQAIGSTAQMGFSLHTLQGKPLATLSLKSDFIDIPNFSFWIAQEAILVKPAIAKVILSPTVVNQILFAGAPDSPRLQESASAEIAINKFSIPLDFSRSAKSPFLPDSIALEADIALSPLLVDQIPVIGNLALKNFQLRIDGKSLASAKCTVTGAFSAISGQGILNDVLGEQTKFVSSANLRLLPGGMPAIDSVSVQIASDLARMDLRGEMREANVLTLTSPAVISYTLTTAALRSLGISTADNFLVQHGTPLIFTVAKSKIPLSWNDAPQLYLAGDLKIHDLSLSHRFNNSLPNALLEKLDLHWIVDASKAIKINFSGATRLSGQQEQGQFSGNAALENWLKSNKTLNLANASLSLNATTKKLPSAFVGAFIKNNDLAPILGNTLDATIAADIALKTALGRVSIDLSSENLTGSASLKFDQGIGLSDSAKPAVFELNLTPQGYAALRNQINRDAAGDFTLAEPARVTMKLATLKTPWIAGSPVMPYWNSAIGMDINIDKLVGIDTQSKHTVTLKEIHGHIFSDDISKHTAFDMKAEGRTTSGLLTALNIIGALENGFNASGSVNRSNLSFGLDANIENLPVPLLCQLACLDSRMYQKLDAIIGPTLDARVKAQLKQMNGPVYIELKGKNGHTVLDAQLVNGSMTLNNNFYAELTVTPQLGKHVLQDLIPFLSGMQGSDQPLKLAIAKEGFVLPLSQFSLQNITINGATLELGKIRFSNEGQLAKVLSLLTTASSSEIMVWLTPAYFSMNNGIFKLERVDMLISDRFPIASWGKVDTKKDNVNMVIALSGSAIQRAFSVSGIKKSYFLQLPLRGTMSNASIDKSKAVARLSALVAQSQGGPHGLVLGTVLDIATGGLSEESPPNPTTNPLPWNNLMEEPPDSATPVQALGNEIDKIVPIEQIGKGAGKLLKNLFKPNSRP